MQLRNVKNAKLALLGYRKNNTQKRERERERDRETGREREKERESGVIIELRAEGYKQTREEERK